MSAFSDLRGLRSLRALRALLKHKNKRNFFFYRPWQVNKKTERAHKSERNTKTYNTKLQYVTIINKNYFAKYIVNSKNSSTFATPKMK